MGTIIKKSRSKAAKIAGAALFILLMFVNLEITTNPNSKGDIDLFGLKISLFIPSAYASRGLCGDLCTDEPDHFCTYIVSTGYCFGYPTY